jgi:hypothetical protein
MLQNKIELPKKGKELTIRIISSPFVENGSYVCNCELYNIDSFPKNECKQIIQINELMYKGMLAQLKKNNIYVDLHMKCLKRVWTIEGKEWMGPTYKVSLRTDLC